MTGTNHQGNYPHVTPKRPGASNSGQNNPPSPEYDRLPSTMQNMSISRGGAYPYPAQSSWSNSQDGGSSHARTEPSSSRGKPPPQPPRKPDTLRYRESGQARQIQSSGEDMSFTKDDIIIAIMGVTGAGKSTFISLLSEENIEIGHGLQSCTSKIGVYYFRYNGTRIFLVDTPGFDDTNRSDSEVLKDVAFWMAAAYTQETRLAGIIYLHRISDTRMGGSATRNLRMFRKLCGQNNLGSVVLATTHWTNLKTGAPIDTELGNARVKQLIDTKEFWGDMVDNGSQVINHDGSKDSAVSIVLNIVGRQNRVILDIQRQLIDQGRDLNETDAAQALQAELLAERKRSEKKLAELKKEMEEAIFEGNKQAQREIRKEQEAAQAEIRKTREETEALRTNLEKITREKNEQFQKLQEEMAKQRKEYQEDLRKTTAALEAEKERQRRAAEQHERERKEDVRRALKAAEEHSRNMLEMQNRIRQEGDERLAAQMESQRQAQERFYEQQREDARVKAEAEEERWNRQLLMNQMREQELEKQRQEEAERLYQLEREQTKSKGFLLGAMKAVCSVASVGLAWAGFVPWAFAADILTRAMV